MFLRLRTNKNGCGDHNNYILYQVGHALVSLSTWMPFLLFVLCDDTLRIWHKNETTDSQNCLVQAQLGQAKRSKI
jgi:hypothetical protein